MSSHRIPDTDVPSDFQVMMDMAEQLASADRFLPAELSGNPGNVLALMLRARALNIPFAVACDELYITRRNNKMAQSARLVRALARRAGHRFFTLESDRHHCVLLIQLAGESNPRRVEFTMQDAHRMGLTDPEGNNRGGHWDRQPENMLYARCTTRGVTRYCPEVILGMGSDFLNEEMPAESDGDGKDPDDVVAAYREEDRALITEVLRAAQETDYLDDGVEREEILIKLGMDYGQVLSYAASEDGDMTVRQVLLARLRSAKDRKEAQARGEEVPAPPPYPTDQPEVADHPRDKAPGGDGPARVRKAAGGRTGARARAAEETGGTGQTGGEGGEPDRQQVFSRVLTEGGTWDRKRYVALHAEMTGQQITGERAAVLLKALHQAHPDRVQHKLNTRYTIVVTGQEVPTPGENQVGVKGSGSPREGGVLPCGCDPDQVVFSGSHGKGCTGVMG